MKNDPLFKFVAAIVLAGLLAALISSSHALHLTASIDREAHASSQGAQ